MPSAAHQDIVERVHDRYLFAMSNLHSRTTGVSGAIIWVSTGSVEGKDLQHGPRIKVAPGTRATPETFRAAVSVRLNEPPEFLGDLTGTMVKEVQRFIALNRATLLQYWHAKIDTAEMIQRIVSIKAPKRPKRPKKAAG